MATVLIAGTTGFTLDAALNAVGFFSPGVVGLTAASGCLGLKKAGESAMLARREARARREREKAETAERRRLEEWSRLALRPRERAQALADRIRTSGGDSSLIARLEQELALRNEGISSTQALHELSEDVLHRYRTGALAGRGGAAPA